MPKNEVKKVKRIDYAAKRLTPEAMKLFKKVNSKYAPPKALKAFKKVPKASIAKRVLGKTLSKAIPVVGVALTAYEIAKGAKKVGKSIKARSACKEKGGVYKKGFCITSKSIKEKMKKK
tara:strand:- start:25097 stop:25453 length:357 start_codon:yes stop_codon:yes gene_type:complete